jgi:glycosyltransferase involved in cell wall biosynthesis
MKILHVVPSLSRGGAEDIIVNLSNHLCLRNEITIFSFIRHEDDNSNLVRLNSTIITKSLFKFNKSSSKIYKIFVKLILYVFSPIIALFIYLRLKIFNFNIVHINMTMSSLYFLFWKVFSCFNKQTKYVETYHTNWHLLKFFNKIIFSLSWSLVDFLIYEIKKSEINIIKKKSFARKIEFIPFAVPVVKPDLSYINSEKLNFKLKNNNTLIYMSIARLRIFEKKYDLILQGFSLLKTKHNFHDFKYIICGDGPDKAILEKLVLDYNLSDNVIFTGLVKKPEQLVYLSDIFVVAMVQMNTGIAGLQAGIANVPLVGFQTEVEYYGENDIIFSSNNINEFSDKLFQLSKNDVYLEYKNNSSNYIKDNFSIDVFLSSYEKIFNSLTYKN